MRQRWKRYSIQKKMGIFFIGFLAALLITFVLLSLQFDRVVDLADQDIEEYYSINAFLDSFTMADRQLEEILRDPSDLELKIEDFAENCNEASTYIREISDGVDIAQEERYLLVNAVCAGYAAYIKSADKVLEELKRSETSYTEISRLYYETTAVIAKYIRQYIPELLSNELSEGKSSHARTRQSTRVLVYGWTTMMIVVALAMIAWMYQVLKRSLLEPLQRMSSTMQEIENGHFEAPDIRVESEDEIQTLARCLNKMKHATQQLVETLRKNSELERQVHLKEQEVERGKRELELARYAHLKSQVNPHFLFNTLNITARLARIEKAERSEKLILALARTFRYSLSMDENKVTLEREIKCVNDYIMIQKMRFEERVRFSWRIEADLVGIESTFTLVPYTIQPFVENAIIHGLQNKVEGGRIRVTIQRKGTGLLLYVTDNGDGMPRETVEALRQTDAMRNGEHIGIYNVRCRLQMLQPESLVEVFSYQGIGTCVKIWIPQEGIQDEDFGCG